MTHTHATDSKHKLLRSASVLEQSKDPGALWETLLDCLEEVDVKFVIYVTCGPAQTDVQLKTNLKFKDLPNLEHFDPFLKYCCDSYAATFTGIVYMNDYPYLDEGSRGFILQAAKMGFKSGIALPVNTNSSHRYGGFNLGTVLNKAEFEEKIVPLESELRTLLLITHRKFIELRLTDKPSLTPAVSVCQSLDIKLTERELDILYLLSKGHSRKECARFCKLSVHTVSDHVKSIYKKLDVTTRYAASQRAKSFGLLETRTLK